MKNLKMTILMMLITLVSYSQINVSVTAPPYVHPKTLGEYPLATFEYVGEVHDNYNKTFNFIFSLIAQNGVSISSHNWSVTGITDGGNTIKNHGLMKTDTQVEIDFVAYVTGGGDLTDPTLVVIEHPELSYDDITNYFVLGNKLDKIQLPVSANAQALIKWMLLNQMDVNGELMKVQFNF